MGHVRMLRVDYPQNWGRLRELDFGRLAKFKREKYCCNMEWLPGTLGSEGGGHLVTFDTPHFAKAPLLEDMDLLREYLPHAESQAITVIAYLNLHWYSYEFAEEHPGWEQVLRDGRPYGRVRPLYGNGTTMCPNSPWREWAFKLIEEAMRTGIKGVFLDGPVVYPGCCYCEHCRKLFEERTGREPPEWGDWESPLWREFVKFRSETMVRFLRDAREAAKRVREDGVVFINSGAWPNWEVPRDVRELAPYQDFSGAEAFFHLGVEVDPYFQLRTGKYLRASGRPSVVFVHHAQGVWHYLPLQGDEMRLALAQTLASGSNTWTALINGELLEREEAWGPVRDVLKVADEHPEAFEGLEPYAPVGIYVSSETALFYRSRESGVYRRVQAEAEEDLVAKGGAGARISELSEQKATSDALARGEAYGVFSMLTHSRIPNRFVLGPDFRDLQVLFLPNAACLGWEEKDRIRKFVRDGGAVVASFEAGRYGPEGEPAEDDFFGEFLGAEEVHGTFPLEVREEYIRLRQGFGSFRPGDLVPRPTYCLKVVPSEDTDVLASFLEVTGQHYAPLKGESPYPALIVRSYGKGKVAYLPALFGEFYRRYRDGTVERFVVEVIRELLDGELQVEVEGPSSVVCEVYRKEGTWVVHLVNCGGDMKRPVDLVPATGVKVRFEKPEVKKVRALVAGRELAIAGGLVEVPRIDVYEVLMAG